MMKMWMRQMVALGCAVVCYIVPTAWAQDAVEPPAAAAAMVEGYLQQLADGNVDAAVLLVDLPQMRDFLLRARLADLKRRDPGLTEGDLQEISRQLQVNELNPARLQMLLKGILQEGKYDGMGWTVARYVRLPDGPLAGEEAYLASVDIDRDGTAGGMAVPVRLKNGEWLVALDVLEAMSAGRNVIPVPEDVPVPDEVKDAVEAFWRLWREDQPDATYQLFAEDFRKRFDLAAYLEQARDLIRRIGIVQHWEIRHCRPLGSDNLALGVIVKGSLGESETVMLYRKMPLGWELVLASFAPPAQTTARPATSGITPPGPALPAAPSFGGGLGGMGAGSIPQRSSVPPTRGPASGLDSGLDRSHQR